MFFYRPSKGNSFGHALRPPDPRQGWPALKAFLDRFFEPSQPQSIELTVDPDLWSETQDHLEECRNRVSTAFGPQPAATWRFTAERHQEIVDFVTAGYPWPGGSTSPLSLSFSFDLRWKNGVLPCEEWFELYSDPPTGISRASTVIVFLQNRSFACTTFLIPIPAYEPKAIEFIRSLAQAAPFKMNSRNFRLAEAPRSGARPVFRKPASGIAASLEDALK